MQLQTQIRFIVAAAIATLIVSRSQAQVDNLQIVVTSTDAVGSFSSPSPIGAFAYDNLNDRMYVAGFGNSSAPIENQQLRRIDNVSTSPTTTTMVAGTAWYLFMRGGNSDNGGGVPGPGGMSFNPIAISNPGISAGQNIWLFDGGSIVNNGSNQPSLTQRIYRYNLHEDTNGDGSDEFTSVMTLSQYQTKAGTASTSSSLARQFAWSGDGQRIYFVDSSTNFGGLWSVPAGGGEPKRLLTTGLNQLNAEPAVFSNAGVDTIYISGSASASAGRIDKVTYDGTTTGTRTTTLSTTVINNFLELSSGSINVGAMVTDSSGTLYFNDTVTSRKGVYGLDIQGRLWKVASYAERQAEFENSTAPLSATMLGMQIRTTRFDGPAGPFDVKQILYKESAPYAFVAGAYLFKPGDFNRDNLVNHEDMILFQQALAPRGVPASTDNLRFDLNGNNEVSWKDVKILQQFYPIMDGDANMDLRVDIEDMYLLATHWEMSGQTWVTGDFTGDGIVNAFDLGLLGPHWLSGVAGVSFADALTATQLSVVPEPSSIVGIGAFGLLFAFSRLHRRVR